jgi:predicted Zn-dependent protease with MMP-like domain
VDRAQFDLIVRRAIEGLPRVLRDRLENIEVIVYDSRNRRQSGRHWKEEKDCYGLIEGRHLPDLAQDPGSVDDLMPTRIILFKKTIEEDYDDPEEMVKCIQDTILHEIGHWFGEDEDDLDRLGLG